MAEVCLCLPPVVQELISHLTSVGCGRGGDKEGDQGVQEMRAGGGFSSI